MGLSIQRRTIFILRTNSSLKKTVWVIVWRQPAFGQRAL
jgi:hypothetical protein